MRHNSQGFRFSFLMLYLLKGIELNQFLFLKSKESYQSPVLICLFVLETFLTLPLRSVAPSIVVTLSHFPLTIFLSFFLAS